MDKDIKDIINRLIENEKEMILKLDNTEENKKIIKESTKWIKIYQEKLKVYEQN